MDDVSNSGQTFEAVCATGETGSGTKKPYIYRWEDGEWGESSSQGASHYRLNHASFSGVDLACEKDDFGFTFVLGTDKGAGVSTDNQVDAFDGMWSEPAKTPVIGTRTWPYIYQSLLSIYLLN